VFSFQSRPFRQLRKFRGLRRRPDNVSFFQEHVAVFALQCVVNFAFVEAKYESLPPVGKTHCIASYAQYDLPQLVRCALAAA
jgi:hypothetical protein